MIMNLSCDNSVDQTSSFHHVYRGHYQRPETAASSSTAPATSSGIPDLDNNHHGKICIYAIICVHKLSFIILCILNIHLTVIFSLRLFTNLPSPTALKKLSTAAE